LERQDRENQGQAELKKRNTEIIIKFIVEHIEPLLEEQAVSCLSKTFYMFIPSGTEQSKLTDIIPANKDIMEGFGGGVTAGSYISMCTTKEYVKVIRLIGQQYGLGFWKQPAIVKELEQSLKSRLKANGEKVAETKRSLAGRLWGWSSLVDGETLSPGYIGVEFELARSHLTSDPKYPEVLRLYAEIP
jgi:hypothetical protein